MTASVRESIGARKTIRGFIDFSVTNSCCREDDGESIELPCFAGLPASACGSSRRSSFFLLQNCNGSRVDWPYAHCK